jgi:hypothetical protein
MDFASEDSRYKPRIVDMELDKLYLKLTSKSRRKTFLKQHFGYKPVKGWLQT